MELKQYLTPRQAEMLTGVPLALIGQWIDTGRVRTTTKRLYSTGHLVVRTADVLEAAVTDGHLRLADVLEPALWPQPCQRCGR